MKFEVLPVLEQMIRLYELPLGMERFNAYLKMIEGNSKGDYLLPVGGFNPMAKQHVLEMMHALKVLGIEELMTKTLQELNRNLPSHPNDKTFKVAFNLSDDLKGGWTNRYVSDYQSKFKLKPLIKREFCVPIFWSSEHVDAKNIKMRTLEFCYRTIYATHQASPKTLKQHLQQELFVLEHVNIEHEVSGEFESLIEFYKKHQGTEEQHILLNFIYGDQAALALGNSPLGIREDFAAYRFLQTIKCKQLKTDVLGI